MDYFLPQGDRSCAWPQAGLAIVVKALEHIKLCKLRNDLSDVIVKCDQTLVDSDQGSNRGGKLGERGNPVKRV